MLNLYQVQRLLLFWVGAASTVALVEHVFCTTHREQSDRCWSKNLDQVQRMLLFWVGDASAVAVVEYAFCDTQRGADILARCSNFSTSQNIRRALQGSAQADVIRFSTRPDAAGSAQAKT